LEVLKEDDQVDCQLSGRQLMDELIASFLESK
jgi:hypothetical protein